jgi:hypothetical protein
MKLMKCSIVLLLAVFAATGSMSARLGDNSDQIEDSYGTMVQRRLRDDGTVTIVYKKGGLLFFVTFDDGRSIAESYSHVKGTALSEREIAKFLKMNAAGATWTPDNTGAQRRFKRSDGKAEATYGTANGRPALTVREIRATRSD